MRAATRKVLGMFNSNVEKFGTGYKIAIPAPVLWNTMSGCPQNFEPHLVFVSNEEIQKIYHVLAVALGEDTDNILKDDKSRLQVHVNVAKVTCSVSLVKIKY